jgi:hypothetical protein
MWCPFQVPVRILPRKDTAANAYRIPSGRRKVERPQSTPWRGSTRWQPASKDPGIGILKHGRRHGRHAAATDLFLLVGRFPTSCRRRCGNRQDPHYPDSIGNAAIHLSIRKHYFKSGTVSIDDAHARTLGSLSGLDWIAAPSASRI